MNLLQIQYLLDAAQSHSIHKTAEKYNISPQGASKAIKMLEQELGVTLVERSTKGVKMTETGEKALPYFEALLKNYDELKQFCRMVNQVSLPELTKGEIALVVTPRFSDSYLGKLMYKFKRKYPNVKLRADAMTNDKIFKTMQKDTVFDIAIVSVLNLEPNISQLSTYLQQHHLQFVSCYTSELYLCATKKTLEQIGEVFSIQNPADIPVVAYEYGGILDAFRAEYEYQLNSITAQMELINHHSVAGAYSLEEFKLHFNTKKHDFIPLDTPVTLTYGYLLNDAHRLSEAEKIFLQFFADSFQSN